MADQSRPARRTVGELRQILKKMGARAWRPRANLTDSDELPEYSTGGDISKFQRAADAPKIDLKRTLSVTPANPNVLERRKELGLLPDEGNPRTPPKVPPKGG